MTVTGFCNSGKVDKYSGETTGEKNSIYTNVLMVLGQGFQFLFVMNRRLNVNCQNQNQPAQLVQSV